MDVPTTSQINVGNLGCLNTSIPCLTLGSGKPVLSIVCGIHGNEITGLFVIERFIRDSPEFRGTVRIITSASPISQALGMRLSPVEFQDLNRVFPGDQNKSFPERVAYHLLKILSDSDMVIDFHSFYLKNPIMSIYMHCGKDEVRSRSMEAIKAFQPEMIWHLETSTRFDVEYKGALGPALALSDVPNFAVEMPSSYRLTDREIDHAYQGILRVMGYIEMTDGYLPSRRTIPAYRREEYYSPYSGLFISDKEIMSPVKEGGRIGRIAKFPDFSEADVIAPRDGTLIQVRDRDFVTTGTPLYALGTELVKTDND